MKNGEKTTNDKRVINFIVVVRVSGWKIDGQRQRQMLNISFSASCYQGTCPFGKTPGKFQSVTQNAKPWKIVMLA